MQTKERSTAAPRGGILRRFLLGEAEAQGSTVRPGTPPTSPILDLRVASAQEWQMAATIRIERLETGMRLIAQTMRQAFQQLSGTLEDLRTHAGMGPTAAEVERMVSQALVPLDRSIAELAGAIQRVPHILAAAAEDMTERMEGMRAELTAAEAESLDLPPVVAAIPHAHSVEPVPFDLEPIEEEFDAIARAAAACRVDPHAIWGEG